MAKSYAAIGPALALIWTSSAAALPALQPSEGQRGPILLSQSFTPPPGSGAPPSTTAGASRSGAYCQLNRANSTIVTPLIPKAALSATSESSERATPGLSLTFQERPSFFWHVHPKTAGETANFLLIERDQSQPQGQQHRLMYEAELDLPSTSGIIRLDLPTTVTALQPNRQYEWFLSFDCDRLSLDSQVHLSGWVKRVMPTAALAEQLQDANLVNQARLLAASGIWQDALMTQMRLQEHLGQTNVESKQQTVAQWQQFLDSAGLGDWANAALLPTQITEVLAYPGRLLPGPDQGLVLRDRPQPNPS
ncbi:MAG: DUF928 domain-containing protein [Synechococcales cyanobacterium RU_4_20]|nr:DUF928 domain-containing protein [Synechococcales cyanobacterium RU_4_20]NJR70565.1 DUF928 domain-containing protein [Synechococcales cyanobacterium CRU_2_2]